MHRAPLLPLQVPSAPRSPGGTMLTGAEWTCAVKINAHCRPERKTIPPQLCKAGGGGGAGNSEQKRSSPFPERRARLASLSRMRVYFDDTGSAGIKGKACAAWDGVGRTSVF